MTPGIYPALLIHFFTPPSKTYFPWAQHLCYTFWAEHKHVTAVTICLLLSVYMLKEDSEGKTDTPTIEQIYLYGDQVMGTGPKGSAM